MHFHKMEYFIILLIHSHVSISGYKILARNQMPITNALIKRYLHRITK